MIKRALPVLFGTLLLDMIGAGMVFPIIPIIFTDPSSPSFILQGYSQFGQYFVAGLVTALFGLMQFIAAPILGELSDVYGRKRLLTLGVGVLAISQLFFGFGIEMGSLALILFSRAIAGLAGANFSIAQAAIADVSKPEDRAKNFGLVGAAFGMGFIIGPLLGGWIVGLTKSAAAPFWLATALGILNLIFVTFMLPETRRGMAVQQKKFNIFKGIQNIRTAMLDKEASVLYLVSFVYFAGFSFLTAFMGVLLVNKFNFDAAGVGTYFGVVGAWIVITQVFILRFLTKRYSERQILRFSLLGLAASIAVSPFLPSAIAVYIVVPFIAIPQGLTIANIQALISKGVSPEKQGAALGINGSLIALASGVIPLVAGIGSGIIGLQAPFLAGGLLVFSAWCLLFWRARRS